MKLPTIKDIWGKCQLKKKLTATEEFIGNYMPIDTDKNTALFKERLNAMIKEVEEAHEKTLNKMSK